MTRAGLLVLALLAVPVVTCAQDNPLEQDAPDPSDEGNPLARAAWIGTFSDGSVKVELHAAHDVNAFEGTITVKDQAYPAKGVARTEDGKTTLEGNLSSGGKDHPFVATLEGGQTLVLVSGGTTYTLTRQVPPADSPPMQEETTPPEGKETSPPGPGSPD